MATDNINQKPHLFGLKFGLSMTTGLITSGLLVGMIWATLAPIIKGVEGLYAFGSGAGYVGLIASLIVFGSIYFVSTYQAGKCLHDMRAKNDTVRILSIIFAALLVIPAIVMLISFVVPLVQLGVGTVGDTSSAVASCICSILSFAVFAKMIAYHVGFRPKLFTRKAYVFGLGGFAAVLIILFMIFPGAEIRKSNYDQTIIDDLTKIDDAVSLYTNQYDALPKSLADLDTLNLDQSIEKYTYTALEDEDESDSYLHFELCSQDFKTNTEQEPGFGYRNDLYFHGQGKACFKRDVYMGYYFGKPDSTQIEDMDYWLE